MTDANNSVDAQFSEELIELRGCMSRNEWELVYLAARRFAQAHGLSIERFDLQSAELDAQRQGMGDLTLSVGLSGPTTPDVGG
jgi:hypothetical protein